MQYEDSESIRDLGQFKDVHVWKDSPVSNLQPAEEYDLAPAEEQYLGPDTPLGLVLGQLQFIISY